MRRALHIPAVTLHTCVRDDAIEPNPFRRAPIDARDCVMLRTCHSSRTPHRSSWTHALDRVTS